MRLRYFYILAILFLLILSNCNSTKKLSYIQNTKVFDRKSDTSFYYTTNPVDYKLNKHDILMIRFASTNEEVTKYFEDFSGIGNKTNQYQNYNLVGFTINDSGYIAIPIIGKFYAVGYTIRGLQNALQKEADKYLINSRIIVKLLNYKISFLGEVNGTGVLDVHEDQINLLEALAQIGGISDYGDRENILIMRKTPKGYHTFRVNITDRSILEKSEFYLLPNDLVIVEPRKYKVLSTNLREYSTLLITFSSILTSITLLFSILNGK